MKEFQNTGEQGELHLQRIDKLPEGVTLREGERDGEGNFIVGHSESGHHHVVNARLARLMENPNEPDICYLVCEASSPYMELVHQKTGPEAHEALRSPPGIFKVTRQSETIMQQRRRVMD